MTESATAATTPPAAPAATPPTALARLRQPLVAAMQVHVPFDGWSRTALHNAAADLGIDPAVADLAFPRGAIQMIACAASAADAAMLAAAATAEFAALPVRERIAGAIRLRLTHELPHRDSVRRAATLLALPHHAPAAARLIWRTADAIWRAAGDTSTDFAHYTKRASVSAVYAATLAYWLGDDSPDCADSWAFLQRRIDAVMRFHRWQAQRRQRAPQSRPDILGWLGRRRYPAREPAA